MRAITPLNFEQLISSGYVTGAGAELKAAAISNPGMQHQQARRIVCCMALSAILSVASQGYRLHAGDTPSHCSAARSRGEFLLGIPAQQKLVSVRAYCVTLTKSGNFSLPSAISFGQTETCLPFCHWKTMPVTVPGPDLMAWVNLSSLP